MAKMLSKARKLQKFLFYAPETFNCSRYINTDAKLNFFIHPKVQKILRRLTHVDIEKVFESKKLKRPLRPPKYKLLTDEELENENRLLHKKTNWLLQMPPILEPKKEINEILSIDPGLDGFDDHHSKFIFIDISSDINSEDRIIVVREPNGILRKAYWNERKRANQIYFPDNEPCLNMPKMFETEYLNSLLDREEYKFVLDSACANFEPDEPKYIEVTRKTYDLINDRFHFSKLHSTRHFGSMTFYLIIKKNIDNMLIDNIQSHRIRDAYSLVQLYHLIHPECKSAIRKHESDSEMLKNFISLSANKKDDIELVLQEYLEDRKEIKNVNAA